VTTRQAAYARLGAIAGAWALGATLAWQLGASSLDPLVPALFAVGAFMLTQDLGRVGPYRGGSPKYWRGRKIDDDDRPRRLH
jgi:hypothetical protein